MTKENKKPMSYEWVDQARRTTLIHRVANGETIASVARSLRINYGNAKCIIASDRKRRARGPGIRKLRGPRYQRLFDVVKSSHIQ